jgi:hypothetical protein
LAAQGAALGDVVGAYGCVGKGGLCACRRDRAAGAAGRCKRTRECPEWAHACTHAQAHAHTCEAVAPRESDHSACCALCVWCVCGSDLQIMRGRGRVCDNAALAAVRIDARTPRTTRTCAPHTRSPRSPLPTHPQRQEGRRQGRGRRVSNGNLVTRSLAPSQGCCCCVTKHVRTWCLAALHRVNAFATRQKGWKKGLLGVSSLNSPLSSSVPCAASSVSSQQPSPSRAPPLDRPHD